MSSPFFDVMWEEVIVNEYVTCQESSRVGVITLDQCRRVANTHQSKIEQRRGNIAMSLLIQGWMLYEFNVGLSAVIWCRWIHQAFGDKVWERTIRHCFQTFRSRVLSLWDELRSGRSYEFYLSTKIKHIADNVVHIKEKKWDFLLSQGPKHTHTQLIENKRKLYLI